MRDRVQVGGHRVSPCGRGAATGACLPAARPAVRQVQEREHNSNWLVLPCSRALQCNAHRLQQFQAVIICMNPLDEPRLCYHVQCLLSQLAFHAWLYIAVCLCRAPCLCSHLYELAVCSMHADVQTHTAQHSPVLGMCARHKL